MSWSEEASSFTEVTATSAADIHNGTTPAAALTTVYTPDPECAEDSTWFFRDSCMPTGWVEYWDGPEVGYYSPGICPSGFTPACERPAATTDDYGPAIAPGETATVCCPFHFECVATYQSYCTSNTLTAYAVTTSTSSTELSSSGLPAGTKIGIGVTFAVVGTAFIAGLFFWWWRRHHRRRQGKPADNCMALGHVPGFDSGNQVAHTGYQPGHARYDSISDNSNRTGPITGAAIEADGIAISGPTRPPEGTNPAGPARRGRSIQEQKEQLRKRREMLQQLQNLEDERHRRVLEMQRIDDEIRLLEEEETRGAAGIVQGGNNRL
ncbi:hypothetical protein BDY21DRAFT_361419 [Lineolata rhizophorae]|uniref:Uncharacterized protein n=1 Tax=Lineolata rhizophorae TaxID=578093 RepID=A0A6A6P9J9_9PEZI|nr:hypothetical protein BDY21DRAFT_361419 [Lineolata rhizophorae]